MRYHSRRILVLQHEYFGLQAVSVPGWFYVLGYPGLGAGLFDVDGMSLAVPYTIHIVQVAMGRRNHCLHRIAVPWNFRGFLQRILNDIPHVHLKIMIKS